MKLYYLTFGSQCIGFADGYVAVSAKSEAIARSWAADIYGRVWSGIYPEEYFGPDSQSLYPKGLMGQTVLYHEYPIPARKND